MQATARRGGGPERARPGAGDGDAPADQGHPGLPGDHQKGNGASFILPAFAASLFFVSELVGWYARKHFLLLFFYYFFIKSACRKAKLFF